MLKILFMLINSAVAERLLRRTVATEANLF